jgi:hypothetical protein
MREVPLHAVAHSRAGDKGNRLNLSLIPYDAAHYAAIAEQVTEARVLALFRHRGATRVVRDVLEGGVNGSLNLDGHGKTHSSRLLSLTLRLPEG